MSLRCSKWGHVFDTNEPFGTSVRKPIGTLAKTGEVCPESGVWALLVISGNHRSVQAKVTVSCVSRYAGKAVTWKLVQYAY